MAHDVFHNPDFDIATWSELQRAIARYGGVELPWPIDEGHCDDCSSFGARFELGRVKVCARDFIRRSNAAVRVS